MFIWGSNLSYIMQSHLVKNKKQKKPSLLICFYHFKRMTRGGLGYVLEAARPAGCKALQQQTSPSNGLQGQTLLTSNATAVCSNSSPLHLRGRRARHPLPKSPCRNCKHILARMTQDEVASTIQCLEKLLLQDKWAKRIQPSPHHLWTYDGSRTMADVGGGGVFNQEEENVRT